MGLGLNRSVCEQLEEWWEQLALTAVTGCVLLGASCGANIADYVARKLVESGMLLAPVKVVAQVLMYPFFIGNTPTHSEIKLSNSYFYDKSMSILAWKLFLP
ncbi:putative carboxylesterase [Helianthus annuus]|nr:putative carboxylesterase [Helianthus annuus]